MNATRWGGAVVVLVAVCASTLACASTSDVAAGHASDGASDSPVDAPASDTADAPAIDHATDAESSDGPAPETDSSTDVADDAGASTKCAAPDLLFPATDWVKGTTQMLPFAGYLWVASYDGLTRVSLPSGTPTKVAGFGAYADLHPHGSKLLVVDGFSVADLDPSTLAIEKRLDTSGAYTNYFPRTALDGDMLYVLQDAPEGSELGRILVAGGTWASLWKGPKVHGIHRGGARSFLDTTGIDFFTVPDPDSDAPVFDAAGGAVTVLAVDAGATYVRWSHSGTSDIHRIDHGSASAVALKGPSEGIFERLASDGTRLVHVTLEGVYPDGELHAEVYSGGTWLALPCIATGTWADAVAIVGGEAYVAIRGTKPYILRLKLPG